MVSRGGLRAGRLLLAGALAAALALAGCGVPAETRVSVDGSVPQRDQQGSVLGPLEPHGPDSATSDDQLVQYFLEAAAGDLDGAPGRLKAFITPEAAAAWQPGTGVTVVRVLELRTTGPVRPGETTVKADLQPVGRLTATGAVEPLEEARFSWLFEVASRDPAKPPPGEPARGGRYIKNPPSKSIYLDSAALLKWYAPNPIYFWDSTGTSLVPDLRYLQLSLPGPARPTQIVRWLLNGPSDWLQPAVSALPPGIDLRDEVVSDGAKLVVNLSAKASEVDPNKLLSQLRWSLRETYPGPVALQIEKQPKGISSGDKYLADNRATSLGEPKAYCVAGGSVAPVFGNAGGAGTAGSKPYCDLGAPALPALAHGINSRVTAAAITRDGMGAALVRQASGGRRQLTVSQGGQDQQPVVSRVGPASAEIGRPVWLGARGQADRGLVPVDRKLYEFSAGGLRPVQNAPHDVTAVAVAPDGRRVALLVNGRAYVATLTVGSRTITLGPSLALRSSIDRVVGIGWTRQDRVVVGGGDNIAEITVDGAVEEVWTVDLYQVTIGRLVALPSNPAERPAPGPVMIEANGRAMTVFVTSYQEIDVLPTPSAPASGGAAPPVATAPLYAD